MLTVLVSKYLIHRYFLLKKCEQMQKVLAFFSKNISVYAISCDQNFSDTNDIVSFEQMDPDVKATRGLILLVPNHHRFKCCKIKKKTIARLEQRLLNSINATSQKKNNNKKQKKATKTNKQTNTHINHIK